MEELEKTIREKLEELRVHLQNDGGDLEIVSIEGKEVRLALKGACGCCPHATMTIKDGSENPPRGGRSPKSLSSAYKFRSQRQDVPEQGICFLIFRESRCRDDAQSRI